MRIAYNRSIGIGGMNMSKNRGKVWLGAAGLVINDKGEWLVVKKAYSGLKGRWSLPAGFVDAGETVDQAVVREIKEETGIDCQVEGLIGFRTGVIRDDISDNMAIFLAQPRHEHITVARNELLEVAWLTPVALIADSLTSEMLLEMAKNTYQQQKFMENLNVKPDPVFDYTNYKLFF